MIFIISSLIIAEFSLPTQIAKPKIGGIRNSSHIPSMRSGFVGSKRGFMTYRGRVSPRAAKGKSSSFKISRYMQYWGVILTAFSPSSVNFPSFSLGISAGFSGYTEASVGIMTSIVNDPQLLSQNVGNKTQAIALNYSLKFGLFNFQLYNFTKSKWFFIPSSEGDTSSSGKTKKQNEKQPSSSFKPNSPSTQKVRLRSKFKEGRQILRTKPGAPRIRPRLLGPKATVDKKLPSTSKEKSRKQEKSKSKKLEEKEEYFIGFTPYIEVGMAFEPTSVPSVMTYQSLGIRVSFSDITALYLYMGFLQVSSYFIKDIEPHIYGIGLAIYL